MVEDRRDTIGYILQPPMAESDRISLYHENDMLHVKDPQTHFLNSDVKSKTFAPARNNHWSVG